MKKSLFLFLLLALVGLGLGLSAQEEQPAEGETPPMGPPPEMKELTGLIGTWDVAMKTKWDLNDTAWTDVTGECEFKFVAGGAALMMEYQGEMPGMPFQGLSVDCHLPVSR